MKIIFDLDKEIKDMEKSGISATEKSDMFKLTLLVQYYTMVQHLSIDECFEKVKRVAKSYFALMPAGEGDKILQGIADRPACGIIKSTILNEDLSVSIYKSEWQKLMELTDETELQLAFTTLVVSKFIGRVPVDDGTTKFYRYISKKETEVFQCANLTKQQMKGRTQESLWQSLYSKGFVDFKADFSYQYPRVLIGVVRAGRDGPFRVGQKGPILVG